ncbi:MAG: VOC family protein [Pseudomonadota bacterium]|nr:VOC family protein [Pseudomonadota bacterium]
MTKLNRIGGLHHYAYRCRNAEETRSFYEDLLGLPLAHVIQADNVPSTGESDPYVHLFFEFGDGSYIAFFDLGDEIACIPDPETPSWVNHFAMHVGTVVEVEAWKKRLEDGGIEVVGVTDHGFVKSIYFFDPNGIRLEITCEVIGEPERQAHRHEAHAVLKAWTDTRPAPPSEFYRLKQEAMNA